MSGVSIEHRFDAADLDRLDRFADRLGDTLPLMRAISSYLRDSTRQRFRDQLAPDGKPWAKSVRAQLDGGTTLVDHGILRDSFNDRATAETAIVGTADKRAAALHFGKNGPEAVKGHTRRIRQAFGRMLPFPVFQTVGDFVRQTNLPARPIVGVSADDRVEISGLVQDFVDMAAAGGAA